MTHHERLPPAFTCDSCGATLSRERLNSLEINLLHKELDQALALINELKPMLITASYFLDQHAHILHAGIVPDSDDATQQRARESHARQLSGGLMDAYCKSAEILGLR